MTTGLPPIPSMAPIVNVPAPELIPGEVPAAPQAAAPTAPPAQEFIPAAPQAAQAPAVPAQAPMAAAPAQAPAAVPAAPPLTAPAIPQAAPVASAPAPTATVNVPAVTQAAPAPSQALAPAPAQTSLVTMGPDGFPQGGSLTQVLESLGFEGISTDVFGIMPIITLTQGEFQKDKVVMDMEFHVQILSSRPKYLYNYGDPQDKNAPSGLFYTYDKIHNANSEEETLEKFMQEAAAAGLKVNMTEYYEVDATLLETNEAVKLSVPKRGSGSQFVKFLTQCTAARRRPQDAVVKVKRGEKVTNVTHPYYPWAFEIVQWR